MMKILILEDNERLSNLMAEALRDEGYRVDLYSDGEACLEVLHQGYDCFILDINIPSLDGLSVLECIRLHHRQIPTLIISANHDLEKIQSAYRLGCDDYLKKPFYIYELVQKVKRFCLTQSQGIDFGESHRFYFDCSRLFKEQEEIPLTPKEVAFLKLFARDLKRIVSYEELEEYVWEGKESNLNNIRALIKRLRKKLPEDSITMITNVGYGLGDRTKRF